MIWGIQILGIIFALVLLFVTYMKFKRGEFTKSEYGFWSLLWVIFILITLFPSALDFILEPLSIVRVLDFLTIGGFMFLIALTFHNYLVVKKNNQKLEALVRKLAKK